MHILALPLLLAIAAPTEPGWLKLFEDEDEITSIDVGSRVRSGSEGVVWIRHDYRRPRADGVRSIRDQWQVSCDRRSFIIYALVSYDANGRILRAQAIPPEERQPAPVVPGSRMERVFSAVCG